LDIQIALGFNGLIKYKSCSCYEYGRNGKNESESRTVTMMRRITMHKI
jgi:hypothetical protein